MRVIAIVAAFVLGVLVAAPQRPWWLNLLIVVGMFCLGLWCCYVDQDDWRAGFMEGRYQRRRERERGQ